jgi:hypothetical protein
MTRQLANNDVSMLPINNKIFQYWRRNYSHGRMGWIAVALIAVFVLFGPETSAQAGWHNSNWQYRKKLNIITWVKIISIWDTDDTQICMHCGNGSATSQQNTKAIWNFGGSNDSRSVWQQPGV